SGIFGGSRQAGCNQTNVMCSISKEDEIAVEATGRTTKDKQIYRTVAQEAIEMGEPLQKKSSQLPSCVGNGLWGNRTSTGERNGLGGDGILGATSPTSGSQISRLRLAYPQGGCFVICIHNHSSSSGNTQTSSNKSTMPDPRSRSAKHLCYGW